MNNYKLLTYIDNPMISKFPATVQAKDAERRALFGREVAESRIGHVVRLQREFVQRRQ